MPAGVGIDLQDVAEVAAAVADHGERYLARLFTQAERAQCRGDARRLAERFAAKEAVLKALGRRDEPVPWSDIEVITGGLPAPRVVLRGAAARLARARGVHGFELSLARSRGRVAAVALASAAGRDADAAVQVQRGQRRGPEARP